jgi:hypothetical protein
MANMSKIAQPATVSMTNQFPELANVTASGVNPARSTTTYANPDVSIASPLFTQLRPHQLFKIHNHSKDNKTPVPR